MKPKIEPCPFCGSSSVQLEGYEAAPGSGCRVRCLACDAEGPPVFGGLLVKHCRPRHRLEAIEGWNGRTAKAATHLAKKWRPRNLRTDGDPRAVAPRSRR